MAEAQPAKHVSASNNEPLLDIGQIQGNVLPGFNKDFQALLFLRIVDVPNFQHWLSSLASSVTTMAQVLEFRSQLKRSATSPTATWLNIAFSHLALDVLGALKDRDFNDEAFRQGLWRRSEDLADPTKGEGDQRNWVVGGEHNEADVILMVASDDRLGLFEEVTRIENSIYAPPKTSDGKPGQSGVRIVFKQYGANLPEPLAGHEHFGFRDGISQPGVRGRIAEKPEAFLTPRQNPKDKNQGKPGQDLLWPGEFVFGRKYAKQDPTNDENPGKMSLDEADPAAPLWAENGSFLVFRRLRQDVGTFHEFLHNKAREYKVDSGLFGAKCVGRWASGAPILRAQELDDPQLAKDELRNNNFEFQGDAKTPKNKVDPQGKVCPFAGHIRKAYPRDDIDESETQTHRLLRRGIPYGDPSRSTVHAPVHDDEDRGLLFLAYQTSIVEQFEFVQNFANNPDLKGVGAGHDPIIGQNGGKETRVREFQITFHDYKGNKQTKLVRTGEKDWVIPTGGGYFFAPSIKALQMLVNPTPKTVEGGRIMAAINGVQWARIWAKALKFPKFRKKLVQDPFQAVKEFHAECEKNKEKGYHPFPDPANTNLFNLDDMDEYGQQSNEQLQDLQKKDIHELAAIIQKPPLKRDQTRLFFPEQLDTALKEGELKIH